MYEFEKNKLKNYLGETIYNEMKKSNAIIAGGMITSLFTNSEINDVDVYFRNNKNLYDFALNNLHHIVSHTNKATQFTTNNENNPLLIQLIRYKYYETPYDIFETFDFTVCMGAFDFETESFIFNDNFFKHNSQRILKFNENTSYPLISAIRTEKYKNKGFTISKAEYFKILLTCMNLNINSYDELKEQLGGMYGEHCDILFENLNDEEFELNKAISYISELSYSDSYFSEYIPIEYCIFDISKDINPLY